MQRLVPIGAAQFLGVFNDHAFKMLTVLIAMELSNSYASDSAFISIVTIVFVSPFILFSGITGYMTDRFSKRNVMVISKFFELASMLLGIYFLANAAAFGIYPILITLFLMATMAAFFSPPYNGILPELFAEKDLSRANGILQMLTFMAIILGVGGGFLSKHYFNGDLYKCGVFFSLLSVGGFFASIKIAQTLPADPKRRWSYRILIKYISNLKYIFSRKNLLTAVLGESYFFVFGSAVQTLTVIFAKYNLHIRGDDAISLGILQMIPAIGMGVGCFIAGAMSRNKVELGLVPLGSAGMIFFSVTAACFSGDAMLIKGVMVYPVFMLSTVMLGLFGGFFVVPLKAYLQHYTNRTERGRFFASANMLCFLLILLSGIVIFYMTAGISKDAASGGVMDILQSHCLSFTPDEMFLGLALVTFIFSAYMFKVMPEFMVRFFIVLITRVIYKFKVKGAVNIPEYGPALLVANHVSFIDVLFITACTSRNVHFMMHEDYYRYPLIHPFVKWTGFIEVPSIKKPKRLAAMFEETKEHLRKGNIVCVFPEGKLTRNGLMDEFKEGIPKMMPEELDVPIIPIRIGMIWGSIFSYYYGTMKFRFPREFPHPASVTVGKPLPKDSSGFRIRQTISELAADTEMEPRDRELPVHIQFAKNVKRHPFRKNIKDFEKPGITNFSLFVRALILSRELKKLSSEKQKYIGVMLPNSSITAVTILAVLIADKVPAILNFTASKQALRDSLEKSNIKLVLTSKIFLEKAGIERIPEMIFLEDVAKKVSTWQRIFYPLLAALMPYSELMKLMSPATHNNVFNTAVVLFSSGSTGKPKGVMLSHHNINSNVYSFLRIMGWTSRDKIAGNLPLFHSFGFTTCFWIPAMISNEVVYLTNPLDSAALGKAIENYGLTLLLATPTFIQTYIRKCTARQFASLRLVITGAEKLRLDIAEKFRKMTGLSLIEGYGCTELSPVVSINVSNSILNIGIIPGKTGSIGAPMPGICVKIVDPETFKELPPDTEGLMLVKGANVMQGYLNEPEKTKEVIRDGFYNTGDIARMNSNGYITITGRLSRFSKIAGEMVPHELIESMINEILATEDRSIAVTGLPDESKGEKLVVLYTAMTMTVQGLIEKLRERQIPNLWIPKAENFFQIEKMPLLGSGKIDLSKIKETAMESAKGKNEKTE